MTGDVGSNIFYQESGPNLPGRERNSVKERERQTRRENYTELTIPERNTNSEPQELTTGSWLEWERHSFHSFPPCETLTHHHHQPHRTTTQNNPPTTMYVAVRPVTGNIIQVFGWSVLGRWCGGWCGRHTRLQRENKSLGEEERTALKQNCCSMQL